MDNSFDIINRDVQQKDEIDRIFIMQKNGRNLW